MFRLLNVPQVTEEIEGKVMIGVPPNNSQQETIGITIITNPNRYVQSGYMNVNVYVPEQNHLARLSAISKILISILEDAQITTPAGDFFFQIEDEKGIIEDNQRTGMVTYNIYINYQIL